MSSVFEIISGSLASGLLTGVGAYVAVVWKLSSRVTILEQKVDTLSGQIHKIDALDAEVGRFQTAIITKLDEVKQHLSDHIGEVKTTCAARTGTYMPREKFDIYAREEDARWQEFNRMMGRLEVLLNSAFQRRLLPERPPMLSSPPPPESSTKMK